MSSQVSWLWPVIEYSKFFYDFLKLTQKWYRETRSFLEKQKCEYMFLIPEKVGLLVLINGSLIKKNVCNASYDIKYMKNEWLLLFIVFELVNSSLLYILSWSAASCLLFLHVSLCIKSNVYLQYCQHSSSTVTSLSGGICMYYFQWSFLKYNIKRMPCAFLYLCWIKWQ